MSTAIIIPTWNNVELLIRCIESILDCTRDCAYRIICVDNGSQDRTAEYLSDVQRRVPTLSVIRNESNRGFVQATNQGLAVLAPGENALLLNDDCQVVDPFWLARLESDLAPLHTPSTGSVVGAVGPVSNFVMGLQNVGYSCQIAKKRHSANLLIGFCLLIRADAWQRVGKLDERFGLGGNDDLDYSIRLAQAGYKLLIDREVFVLHHGCQTIGRLGGYERFEPPTRQMLIAKWGQARVDELFRIPEDL